MRDQLTLQTLFDNYLREVTPGKSPSSRQNDRHTAKLFHEYFGAERKIVTLSRRDWDAFISAAGRGAMIESGRSAGSRSGTA